MKKIIIILITFLSLYTIYKINYTKVDTVGLYLDTFSMEDYNIFYLDLSNEFITTKNILKYISNDIDIVSIKPYINEIYKDKINIEYNFMNNISNKKNIKNFINYYKDVIRNSGYIDDIGYIDIDGIQILEIKIYAKGIDVINLIRNTNIKYKTVFNGEYDYLEV